jgi:uncharacterized protein YfiM (DUF2279 family)
MKIIYLALFFMKSTAFLFLIVFLLPASVFGQIDTADLALKDYSSNKNRVNTVIAATSVLYAGTMGSLYSLWYKDYPLTSFHTFDDNYEWLQMDKAGHITTAYYIGMAGIGVMKWTGMERKKAAWYGASIGWIFLASIEMLDGFSPQWGFSSGDMFANTAGAAFAVFQETQWQEQRLLLKFSFSRTNYPQYRPALLGEKWNEEILKDYNGQTYWLSANIRSFLGENSSFPKWLNLAVGYGAGGMTGGKKNPDLVDGKPIPSFKRYRQFYIAPDIDLTRIKTRSKFFNTFCKTIGFLKFPLPAVEFYQGKLSFHPVYF